MDFKTSNGTETETPSPAGENNLIQNLINDNKTVNEMDFIFGQANMNKPPPTNGKRPVDELEQDEDMGPETDVDVVDEVNITLSSKIDNIKEDICETNPFTDGVDNKDIEMLGEVIDRVEGNCLDFFRQEFSEKKDDSFEKESNIDLLAGGKIETG